MNEQAKEQAKEKAEALARELDGIAQAAPDGLLRAEDVVSFAERNAASALHGEFEWDDTEAARKYRVEQARGLIRVVVTVLPSAPKPVRAFVSIPTDRVNGGGYRRTAAALKSDGMRAQMVADVLGRIDALKTTASTLPELGGLFAEIGVLIAQYRAAQMRDRDAA